MLPELGKYSFYVLGSYAATLAVLAGLVLASWRASVRARRELERLEARHGRRRGGAE